MRKRVGSKVGIYSFYNYNIIIIVYSSNGTDVARKREIAGGVTYEKRRSSARHGTKFGIAQRNNPGHVGECRRMIEHAAAIYGCRAKTRMLD